MYSSCVAVVVLVLSLHLRQQLSVLPVDAVRNPLRKGDERAVVRHVARRRAARGHVEDVVERGAVVAFGRIRRQLMIRAGFDARQIRNVRCSIAGLHRNHNIDLLRACDLRRSDRRLTISKHPLVVRLRIHVSECHGAVHLAEAANQFEFTRQSRDGRRQQAERNRFDNVTCSDPIIAIVNELEPMAQRRRVPPGVEHPDFVLAHIVLEFECSNRCGACKANQRETNAEKPVHARKKYCDNFSFDDNFLSFECCPQDPHDITITKDTIITVT